MWIKEKFQQYISKQDRRLREQDTAARYRLRNRKYHGYFEGYTEYTRAKPNGKTKICRVYTADYYRQALSLPGRILLRAGYVLLFLLAAYCLFSGCMDVHAGCNYVWYATACQAGCVASLFWVFATLFSYIPAGGNWKLHDYRVCHTGLRRAALTAAGFFGAVACGAGIYTALHGTLDSVHVILRAILGGAAVLAIWQLESRLQYEIVENPVRKDYAGGVEIQ